MLTPDEAERCRELHRKAAGIQRKIDGLGDELSDVWDEIVLLERRCEHDKCERSSVCKLCGASGV